MVNSYTALDAHVSSQHTFGTKGMDLGHERCMMEDLLKWPGRYHVYWHMPQLAKLEGHVLAALLLGPCTCPKHQQELALGVPTQHTYRSQCTICSQSRLSALCAANQDSSCYN